MDNISCGHPYTWPPCALADMSEMSQCTTSIMISNDEDRDTCITSVVVIHTPETKQDVLSTRPARCTVNTASKMYCQHGQQDVLSTRPARCTVNTASKMYCQHGQQFDCRPWHSAQKKSLSAFSDSSHPLKRKAYQHLVTLPILSKEKLISI